VINVALTVFWVVGLINAFNLMDNMDGSCATVTIIAAGGAGLIAALEGRAVVAGLAFGLAGAAAGFLRWNLARPARIFLGDGGSMVAGFLVAALVMGVARRSADGDAGLLLGALLVGVPILDVTLVSISRWRRGVTLTTGGVDHLTHRIALVRRSPRAVAATLAAVQLGLCALAIAGHALGPGVLAGLAFAAFVTGVAAIAVLDTARWRPSGIAVGAPKTVSGSRRRARRAVASTQGEQP
jgi:UDP-GlcNAc:undecaprenyl-phosphate GlcNAc-1-phosphate transferase